MIPRFATSVQVEVDSLPEKLYEHARDWGELAVTRLLAEPLFEEAPNRGLRSTLVVNCQRNAKLSWELTLSDNARWNTGEQMTSTEICEQIARARYAAAAPLSAALMIKSMTVVSSDTIHFETRIPVAHLDRILANPGLAPRRTHSNIASGPYNFESRSSDRMRLSSARAGRSLDLVYSPRACDMDPFNLKQVDVSGPISTSPVNWSTVSRSITAALCPLDIVYVLMLPEWLPSHFCCMLQLELNRHRICEPSKGSVAPCHRMTDLWTNKTLEVLGDSKKKYSIENGSSKMRLFYTDFPSNLEIATGVAQELNNQFKVDLAISPCEYAEFISTSTQEYKNAFRLALSASLWPHPIGMLAPFYFGGGASSSFQKSFMAAADADDLVSAANLAAQAEDILVTEGCRMITLGRVTGCLRSRIGELWCPPSGWIDYSRVNNI